MVCILPIPDQSEHSIDYNWPIRAQYSPGPPNILPEHPGLFGQLGAPACSTVDDQAELDTSCSCNTIVVQMIADRINIYLSRAVVVTLWSISHVSVVSLFAVKTLLELPGSDTRSPTVLEWFIKEDHVLALAASRPMGKDWLRWTTASHQKTQTLKLWSSGHIWDWPVLHMLRTLDTCLVVPEIVDVSERDLCQPSWQYHHQTRHGNCRPIS